MKWSALAALATMLSACGGGSGGGEVQSTPNPPPTVPTVNYDTTEYRASNGPVTHMAISAYDAGASGAGVTVGVIDTGISDPSGALAGRISPASRDFSGNGSLTDISGHGTSVSMIVAAARDDRATMGVAWGADIMALRTDRPGSCNPGTSQACLHMTDVIADALDHAVVNGAKVVNISLGGTPAPRDLRDAVSRATAAGTIIVISAGNGGADAPDPLAATIADPAIGRGLVVIATALNDQSVRASFSNGALGFEDSTIAALGVGVRTLDASGNVVGFSGTSAATPIITGAVALLRQAFPTLSPAEIVGLLLDTARDIGESGVDSVYGHGMLDLARAFAPRGTLRVAGSSVPLQSMGTGQLASAMGDAAVGQGVTTVVIDSLGRAYSAAINPAMRRIAPGLTLLPAVGGTAKTTGLTLGGAAASFSFLPRATGTDPVQRGARLLAARVAARIAPGAHLAFGVSNGAGTLEALLDPEPSAAFLASGGAFALSPEFRPEAAVAMRQALGRGLILGLHAERGRVRDASPRLRGSDAREGSYRLAGASVRGAAGPASLTVGVDHLAEDSTALGARFDPLFGAQSAQTVMGMASASFRAGQWTLGGSYRHGWTRAGAGGLLDRGGRLRSAAWSVEAVGSALLTARDSFALRLAQPLRVEASDFALRVPTDYDYATGAVTFDRTRFDLTPAGRERVAEIVYAAPAAGGWLTANLYRRVQPGHVAAARDDMGMALRFEADF